MRTFYIFKIKKEFYDLYLNNPNNLYSILKQLYYIKKKDFKYGFSMLNQIIDRIDSNKLNRQIFIQYHNEMYYTKNDNDHIINNLFKNEVSILTVRKTYILINANKNYSSFFNVLDKLGSNYFICDFINKDYFWINDIKILV